MANEYEEILHGLEQEFLGYFIEYEREQWK